MSKLPTHTRPLGVNLPVHGGKIALEPDSDAVDAFQLIGLSCVQHFALNARGLGRGEAEAVHQMRVGLRRLRAAISLFKELCRDGQTEAIKAQLRWLTGELGPARDYDVLIAEHVAPLKESDNHQLELAQLESVLRQRRTKKVALAQTAVASEQYRQLVRETAFWLTSGDWVVAPDRGSRRLQRRGLRTWVRRMMRRRARKVRRKLARLEQLRPEQRHKLRISVKKLHYGTQFLGALFPKRASRRKRFVKVLKELQGVLGKLNDMRIHEGITSELLQTASRARDQAPTREEAFAVGLVAGHEVAHTADLLQAGVEAGKRLASLPCYWD